MIRKIFLSLSALSMIVFASCDSDDDNTSSTPTTANLRVTIENVVQPGTLFLSGTSAIPVGQNAPGPILPGDAYEFIVNAGPNVVPGDGGTRLNFVTMFVQSNDLFLAPDGGGIPLYDANGNPISGDVTSQVLLWDAGTEVNEQTGGPNQKPQQSPTAEDQGMDENGVVTEILNNTDGINTLPDVDEVMLVTITPQGQTEFLVRIENVSNSMTIATPAQGAGTTAAVPISPVVYAVHTGMNPFFTTGQAASPGLEDIAEDGFITVESARVESETALIIPMSPGVWAVHDNGVNPFFTSGNSDRGDGLEAIAEDGDPSALGTALSTFPGVISSAVFNTPVGASAPGPIGPGGSYSFDITASTGDYLSLTTMSVQSNDWIYTFPSGGIPLFNASGVVTGDVTSQILLYDVGTEIDEFPGAGLNQVIRQSGPNTGPADPNTNVRQVNPFPDNVPPNNQVIRVTITQI